MGNSTRTTLKVNPITGVPEKHMDQYFPEDFIKDMKFHDQKRSDLMEALLADIPSIFVDTGNVVLVDGATIDIPLIKGFIYDDEGLVRQFESGLALGVVPDISAGDGSYYIKYSFSFEGYGSERVRMFRSTETYQWQVIETSNRTIDQIAPVEGEICVGGFNVAAGVIVGVHALGRTTSCKFKDDHITHEDGKITEEQLTEAVQVKLNAVVDDNLPVINFRGLYAKVHSIGSSGRLGQIVLDPSVPGEMFTETDGTPYTSIFQQEQEYPVSRKFDSRVSGGELEYTLLTESSLSEGATHRLTISPEEVLTHSYFGFYLSTLGSDYTGIKILLHDSSDILVNTETIAIGDLVLNDWNYVELFSIVPPGDYHYHIVFTGAASVAPKVRSSISADLEGAWFKSYYRPTGGNYPNADLFSLVYDDGGVKTSLVSARASGSDAGGADEGVYDYFPVDFSDEGLWESWEYENYIGIDIINGRIKLPPGLSVEDYFIECNIRFKREDIHSKGIKRYNENFSIEESLDTIENRDMTIAGNKKFTSPVSVEVSEDVAPLVVSSQKMVDNLNAEMVGGKSVETTMTYSNDHIATSKAILDKLYPVGSFYVQYPNAASNDDTTAFPVSARPATMFGGTWVEQFNTDATFFRTGGTNGQPRTNGLSRDQMQGHWHELYIYNIDGRAGDGGGRPSIANVIPNNLLQNPTVVKTAITDGTNGTPRTGTVTEPRNRLMKLWKRTVL